MEMNDEPDTNIKQQTFVIRNKNSFHENKEETDDTLRDSSRDIETVAQDASFFSRNSATSCVMQIKTIMDSVIAGRTLYLSTRQDHSPEQLRQAIVTSLSDAVAIARKKAQVLSRFQKTQEQVRWVQSSMIFQMVMAALIMLVSYVAPHATSRNDPRRVTSSTQMYPPSPFTGNGSNVTY